MPRFFILKEKKVTLTQYRTRLAAIETAIDDAIATGQSYAVVGSMSSTAFPLSTLETMRERYRKIILRLSGYNTKRSTPDFSG